MSREVHVRFWESAEVQFLRATQLPVLKITSSPLVIAAHPGSGIGSVKELIAAARKDIS